MAVTPKRPRDPNALAKSIVDIATGQAERESKSDKNEAAAEMGRKGGKARAEIYVSRGTIQNRQKSRSL